jgi:CheY-like chemotaxis protein
MKEDNKLNILIVEDNNSLRVLYESILDELDVKYIFAKNGIEGLNLYINNSKNNQFNIVLSDIDMPFMNGIEMTKKIREYETNGFLNPTKIYSISGNGNFLSKEKCYLSGFNDCFSKDSIYETILNIIEDYQTKQ